MMARSFSLWIVFIMFGFVEECRPSQLSAQQNSSQLSTQQDPSQLTTQQNPSQLSTQQDPSQLSTQQDPSQLSTQQDPSQLPNTFHGTRGRKLAIQMILKGIPRPWKFRLRKVTPEGQQRVKNVMLHDTADSGLGSGYTLLSYKVNEGHWLITLTFPSPDDSNSGRYKFKIGSSVQEYKYYSFDVKISNETDNRTMPDCTTLFIWKKWSATAPNDVVWMKCTLSDLDKDYGYKDEQLCKFNYIRIDPLAQQDKQKWTEVRTANVQLKNLMSNGTVGVECVLEFSLSDLKAGHSYKFEFSPPDDQTYKSFVSFPIAIRHPKVELTHCPAGESVRDGFIKEGSMAYCGCPLVGKGGPDVRVRWIDAEGKERVNADGTAILSIDTSKDHHGTTYHCERSESPSISLLYYQRKATFMTKVAHGPHKVTIGINFTPFIVCPESRRQIPMTCSVELNFNPDVRVALRGFKNESIVDHVSVKKINKYRRYSYSLSPPSQGGVYPMTCVAHNALFNDIRVEDSTYVIIEVPPPHPPVLTIDEGAPLTDGQTVNVTLDQPMTFTCEAKGGYPGVSRTTLTLGEDDDSVTTSLAGDTARETFVAMSEDDGRRVWCHATHKTGCYEKMTSVILHVQSNEDSYAVSISLSEATSPTNTTTPGTILIIGAAVGGSVALLLIVVIVIAIKKGFCNKGDYKREENIYLTPCENVQATTTRNIRSLPLPGVPSNRRNSSLAQEDKDGTVDESSHYIDIDTLVWDREHGSDVNDEDAAAVVDKATDNGAAMNHPSTSQSTRKDKSADGDLHSRVRLDKADNKRAANYVKVESDDCQRDIVETAVGADECLHNNNREDTAYAYADADGLNNNKEDTAYVEADECLHNNNREDTAYVEADGFLHDNNQVDPVDVEADGFLPDNNREDTAYAYVETDGLNNNKKDTAYVKADGFLHDNNREDTAYVQADDGRHEQLASTSTKTLGTSALTDCGHANPAPKDVDDANTQRKRVETESLTPKEHQLINT